MTTGLKLGSKDGWDVSELSPTQTIRENLRFNFRHEN